MDKSKRTAASSPASGPPAQPSRHWVMLQGDWATVEEGVNSPNTDVEQGQRRRKVMGVYIDQDDAAKVAESINERARIGTGL